MKNGPDIGLFHNENSTKYMYREVSNIKRTLTAN